MRQHIETQTIKNAYNAGYKEEINRITEPAGILEFEFICNILERYLNYSLNVVYDIGSGSGKYTEYFLRKGILVGCVDISENLIKHFRNTIEYKLKDKLLFNKVCCATQLGWIPPESADMVILMGPMYHLIDMYKRRKVWYHMNKILKKDSLLIVVFLDCLDNNLKDLIREHNILSYRKFANYDISRVRFGGISISQFRTSPLYAEEETKEWFDVVNIEQFPGQSAFNLSKSSNIVHKTTDQYIIIFKKK